MGRFVKPMSAAAASDGAEASEEARSAHDAQFSIKRSETLRKRRDESAGIKVRALPWSPSFLCDNSKSGVGLGLPSSSEDDEHHFVQLLVRGKRTRTPNK
jgi:hypothetical protein